MLLTPHQIPLAVEAAAAMARLMAMAAVVADIVIVDDSSHGARSLLPVQTVGCQLASGRFLVGRRERVVAEMRRSKRLAGSGTGLMNRKCESPKPASKLARRCSGGAKEPSSRKAIESESAA